MSVPANPVGRKEAYLASMAGVDTEIPTNPVGRTEEYLQAIAQHGVLPKAPTEDGTYILKCTVSSGEATYSWISE